MKNRGVALVSVLLIVAVATALAVEMIDQQTMSLAHGAQTLDGSQAREYAIAGEEYARQVLYDDWFKPRTKYMDTLLESWIYPMGPAFAIDHGSIEIRIEDLARRFNLNSVIGDDGVENMNRLKRLLAYLQIDPNVADAWLDWLDPDTEVHGFGAEDIDLLARRPARRTANQRAYHVSEFPVATGISKAEYRRLRPYITVLPVLDLRLNVNTASPILLGIVAPEFSPDLALPITSRPRKFPDVQGFVAGHPELSQADHVLSVVSEFFRVQVRAHAGQARTELTSFLHRDPASGELALLSRSFGERYEELAQTAAVNKERGERLREFEDDLVEEREERDERRDRRGRRERGDDDR